MADEIETINSDHDSHQGNDPLIEIDGLRGRELLKKSQLQGLDTLVVRCTICRSQINHLDHQKVKKHRRLKVITCKDCFDFYGSDEFSRDENGNFNYCTWCGNGGTLFLCDFCPNVYCINCVRRNFGRAEVAAMQKDGWKCYICDPNKLKAKVAYCDLILEYSLSLEKKSKKAEPEKLNNKELISETWMLEAFTKTQYSCKTLITKIDKLKNIETSRSKSLRHVIKKMEEVVGKHKDELNHVIKTVSDHYMSYIKLKQEEEQHQRNEDSTVNDITVTLSDSDDDVKLNEGAGKDSNKSKEKHLIKNDNSIKSEVNGNLLSSKKEKTDKKDNIVIKKDIQANDIDTSKQEINMENEVAALLHDSSDDEILNSDSERRKSSQLHNITVTAEVHSSEFPDDSDFVKKMQSISKVTARKSMPNPIKKVVTKTSSISSLSSLNLKSEDESDSSLRKKKIKKKPRTKTLKEIDYVNDKKLRLPIQVVVERCDDMLGSKTTIKLPEDIRLEDIDKEIKNAIKDPKKSKKKVEPRNTSTTTIKKSKPKKASKEKDSSSSIEFSTSEDEISNEIDFKDFNLTGKENKLDPEEEAKKNLLESDDSSSDISSHSSDSVVIKKKKSKKAKGNSASSDDFQPRKKKKYDKLLNKPLFSDNDSSKDSKKITSERKHKRKLASSDEDFKTKNEKSSESDTSNDSDNSRKPKTKKRRRIKKPADSSSGEETKEAKEKETPKKGRKDIKKIISKKDLKQETKEAQMAEKERKKRLEEKQKLYNMITETREGNEIITKKLVLEIDPVSKEEIVQIHPDLIEKLKPHQVKGVKFMWECTIESLEALKKEPGSGCILAHCMGLGKTLQVITFLHTCLTNVDVNKHIKTAMVICPYNTVLNWSREVEQWLNPLDTEPILLHEMNINAKDNYARLDILKYWNKEGGILIISYDLFRRLATTKIPKLKKTQRDKVQECLLDPGPDIVICDEGHILKNEKSAVSKACNQIHTQRRIVLTGTPLQNNLKEYHCMLSFVKPHLLGTLKEFQNRFVNPIMNGQYEDSNEYDVRRMKKRIHILHKLLEGCVQRCDYFALTKFLPPKYEYVISVKLSDIQVKMYRWYLDNMSKAKSQVKIQGGTLFQDYNTLRNLCTHPYMIHTAFVRAEKRRALRDEDEEELEGEYDDSFIDDDTSDHKKSQSGSGTDEVIREYKTRSRKKNNSDSGKEEDEKEEEEVQTKEWYHEFISESDAHKLEVSGKMVLLFNILKECESIGDKVIVFSQSLLTLDCIEELLEHAPYGVEGDETENCLGSWIEGLDYFRMDGTTSADYRKSFIDLFNNPNNPRARLFLVSTRAGGLGTNLVGANRVVILDASWNPSHDVQAFFRVYRFGQKKPVYIYRLLAQGTMEEKVYDRQVSKLSLSIRVVDEQQIDRHFNSQELAELYTFDPESLRNRPTPMVPNDRLLAEMLMKYKDLIVSYHEHDSLLQNENEEDLTEEERKAAWNEYENEREGRNITVDDEISKYCKEPDFDLADYDTPILPTAKFIIDDLLSETRIKCNGKPIEFMRKTLLQLSRLVKARYQEIHVRVLRMKQEFLTKGSVPSTVNKYLEELNTVINQMSQHCDKIAYLVAEDDRKLYQAAYQNNLQAQMQANLGNLPRGFQSRFPMNFQQIPTMNNFPQNRPIFTSILRPGNIRYPNVQFIRNNMPQQMSKNYSRQATSEPVVTIPTEFETPPKSTSETPVTSKSGSSVVIEEIE